MRGSGKIITQTREVSKFERVDVCCGMELYLTQGSHESLEIKADDNLLDEIRTDVVNGTLEIRYRTSSNVNYWPTEPVRLYLSAVVVRQVSISGGGEFEVDTLKTDRFDLDLSGGSDANIGNLSADQITINVSGGGDITADQLVADRLDVDLSGGSDAEIRDLTADIFTLNNSGGGTASVGGSVNDQKIDLSGGSNFQGDDLESQSTTISCSGGGNSKIWVTETLEVDLSGGSDLHYYGSPAVIDQNLSGDSKLESLGER